MDCGKMRKRVELKFLLFPFLRICAGQNNVGTQSLIIEAILLYLPGKSFRKYLPPLHVCGSW